MAALQRGSYFVAVDDNDSVLDRVCQTLELRGVGYRVQQSGKGIVLNVGYSHPVEVQPLEGVTLEVEGNNRVHVRGIDKQLVFLGRRQHGQL